MYNWREIQTWAKKENFKISKTAKVDEYFWDGKTYHDLSELVKDLWNKKTDNKFVEYQKQYKAEWKPETT